MITIEFCKEGIPVSYFEYVEWTEYIKTVHGPYIHIKVSTEMLIHSIRAEIAEGKIPHTEIRFLYDDNYLYPGKDGRLEWWPKGFCDAQEIILGRIIWPEKKVIV